MGALSDLADKLDKLVIEDLPLVSNEIAKEVAIAVINDLLQVNPVDTGKALSNWQVSLGALPPKPPIPAHVPSPKGHYVGGKWTHRVDPGVTASANIPTTKEAAAAVIAGKEPHVSIWITNMQPYIAKLNAGSSTQAPAGWVERAVVLGSEIASRSKVKL